MKKKRCIINVLKYTFFITLCIGIVSAISSQTVKSTTAYVSSLSVECINSFEGIATEPTTQTSSAEETTASVPPKPTESTPATTQTQPTSTQVVTETSAATTEATASTVATTQQVTQSTSPTSQGSSPTTTGDRNNFEWYVICIIISAMGLAICWRLGKDKN